MIGFEFTDAFLGWMEEYRQQQGSKFGRCAESAGSEDKGSNEQRPIQDSKFGAERATDGQVSGDASATAKHLKRVDALAPVDSGLGCTSRAMTSAPFDSCGHGQAQADAHLEPVQTGWATAGITCTAEHKPTIPELPEPPTEEL